MDISQLTDEQLVVRIVEPGHFEELYRRHVGKVTSFASRRCSTAHQVPDLVAAVWLEVIASAGRFDSRRGRALPWILGVAANLTASHERRLKREREALQRLGRRAAVDAETAAELDARIDAVKPARTVMETLADLPLGERVVAELVFVEGLRPQEAARALGLRPATARMRLLRARKKLQHAAIPWHVKSGVSVSEV